MTMLAYIRRTVPEIGIPIEIEFGSELHPLRMVWRKDPGKPAHEIIVHSGSEQLPFRDRAILDYEQNRLKLADTIAKRFGQDRKTIHHWFSACYEGYRQLEQKPFRIYTATDESVTPKPVRFLIGNWCPENSVTMISADGGVGKSALATLWSLILGGQLTVPWSSTLTEPISWVYLDWENQNENNFYHRTQILADALWNSYGHILLDRAILQEAVQRGYYIPVYAPLGSSYTRLTDSLQELNPKLVIIDSASMAIYGSLNDETVAREHMQMVHAWTLMGMTVVIVSHIAKEDVRSRAKIGPYGSRMFYNLARQIVQLQPRRLQKHSRLDRIIEATIVKNNYGPSDTEPVYYYLFYPSRNSQAELITMDTTTAMNHLVGEEN
jgi:RecA-family ATPase